MNFRRLSRRAAAALFVAAGLLLSQCNTDDTAEPTAGNATDNEYVAENGPKVTTTLSGAVLDEEARPVAGALVEAYGEATTTDAAGEFSFESISVPANRCYLKCTKSGYFTASTAYIPQASGDAVVRLVMMSDAATHQVDAATGGTAQLPDGSSVQLPANGIVQADGTPYKGEVNVTVRHLSPADENFMVLIPGGDLAARRADNSGAMLYSYGMLRVLLRDDSGNDLQLASGKESTITMSLPDVSMVDAPATIPLWYFDEETGLWLEEGEATRQGNKYVGQVKHFTDWNCDFPGQGVEVELQFVSEGGGGPGKVEEMPVDPENPGEPIVTGGIPCTGYPHRNVFVKVGQVFDFTDENGIVRRRVPDNRVFPVLLYNGPGLVQKVAEVGPFSRADAPVKRTFKVPCPVFVVGRTVCNGVPFQADFVLNTNEILSYGKRPTDGKGVFRVTVAPGYESSITVTDPSTGKKRNITFTAPKEDGVTVTLGNIELCATPQSQVNDNVVTFNGDGYNNETIDLNKTTSPDGNPLYGYCIDGQITKAVVGNDMVDKVSYSLQWPGCGKPGIFNGTCPADGPCTPVFAVTIVKDGKRLNYYTRYGPNNSEKFAQVKLTITRSDDKLIEGTFSGIVTRHDSKTNTWHDLEIKDAKFSVRTVKQ